jgi:endonuclease YncB( thermonuclease family)
MLGNAPSSIVHSCGAHVQPSSLGRRNLRGEVLDGDTIVVAGERIRLERIDAPELHQTLPPTARSGRAAEPRRSGCRNT